LNALSFVFFFILSSNKDEKAIKKLDQFALSSETESQPSEFEISFIHKDYLFRYGFKLNKSQVLDEWLYATELKAEKQKEQTWIERQAPKNKIGTKIDGSNSTKKSWLEQTRDNALILSTAVQLNSAKLKIPHEWFELILLWIPSPFQPFPDKFSIKMLDSPDKDKVLQFMKAMDFSFSDIQIEKEKFDEKKLFPDDSGWPPELKKLIIKKIIEEEDDGEITRLRSIYNLKENQSGKNNNKSKEIAYLDFSAESDGTRALFHCAGPILDVLKNGYTLIVDELDRSLHPLALRAVIELFTNKKTNPNHAQLIFTTHNTSVMNLFQRDQIWLIEKNSDYATKIFSVNEFEGRADEIVEKRYLSGRYGALPRIGDLL
jgi:AAA15 family ATPase/GTPase